MARSLIASSAVLCALALAGCSNGSEGQVKLGVDVAAITVSGTETSSDTSNSSDLVLSRVRILVSTAKVGYIDDQKGDGPAAESGPVVIDLTADEIANGAHRDFDLGTLATGTYGGAEIEIEPLDADDAPSGDELADFLSSGASVIVDGTYQGASFQFAGHFLAEQGTDGDVEIDEGSPVTLALTVDASSWFKDAAGAILDPTDAAQHDALAVAICETLDTQVQGEGPAGDGSHDGSGSADQDGSAPPAGSAEHDGSPPPAGSADASCDGGAGGMGDGGKGGHGKGGRKEHCVENAP